MSFVRQIVIVGVSVGAAIAAGSLFAPQSDPDASVAAQGAGAAAIVAAATTAPPVEPGRGDRVPTFANLTEIAPAPVGSEAGAEGAGPLASSAVPGDEACPLDLAIAPVSAARITVEIVAPCDAGEPVALVHGPLRLGGQIDDDGLLRLTLPAMAPEAEVTLAMLDGRNRIATASVTDFGRFDRLAVLWDGSAAVDLHAYLDGAAWQAPGHVYAGLPVSTDTGFVARFGDAELGGPRAAVYTFPEGLTAGSGRVRVEAEIAITPETCGTIMRARVLTISDREPVRSQTFDVAMPDCDGAGGFVRLPDLALPAPQLARIE